MLRVPPLQVTTPGTIDEALQALAAGFSAKVLAGGTDLVPSLKLGIGRAEMLVSLASLNLSYIKEEKSGEVRIGAATTLKDIELNKSASRTLSALRYAASLVAAPPIRSRGTLGGNLCIDNRCSLFTQSEFFRSGRPPCFKAGGSLCNVSPGFASCNACNQSDMAVPSIALGASVEIQGAGGARDIPLEKLYSGDGARPLTLSPSDLVTSVILPALPLRASVAFRKARARKSLDFAFASAAVSLAKGDDGLCRNCRVVIGAVGTAPLRVAAAEEALEGTSLTPEALEKMSQAVSQAAKPVKNADMTPAYRRKIAGVMAVRAAKAAWEDLS